MKKRMGRGTYRRLETAFVHITVIPKNGSDVGFANTYRFERNTVKVILKGQAQNLHLGLSFYMMPP